MYSGFFNYCYPFTRVAYLLKEILMNKSKYQTGFSLIELIGVIVIIVVLVASITPRVIQIVNESKANKALSLYKSLVKGVSKLQVDLGRIVHARNFRSSHQMIEVDYFLDQGGNNSFAHFLQHKKTLNNKGDSWLPFKGPYINSFKHHAPPIGTQMGIDLESASGSRLLPSINNDENYDLFYTGKGAIPNLSTIATLRFEGVKLHTFELIDQMIDHGQGDSPRRAGKVKYNGNELRIYISHD